MGESAHSKHTDFIVLIILAHSSLLTQLLLFMQSSSSSVRHQPSQTNHHHIFPLPSLPMPYFSYSSSRRCIQRAQHSRSLVILINSVIISLNYLFNKNIFASSQCNSSSSASTSIPSIAQSRVISNLVIHVKRFYRTDNAPLTHLCRRNDGHQRYRPQCDASIITQLSHAFFQSFVNPHAVTVSHPSSPPPYQPYSEYDSDHTYSSTYSDIEPSSIPSLFSYNGGNASSAVPLIASKVALPDTLHSIPMLSVLPPSIAAYYNNSSDLFDTSSQPEARASVQPKVARAFATHTEYISLIRRMRSVGMVNFTSSPTCVNGCFGVPKPDGDIRLVIDAQPANALFALPPHVDLPNPSHIALINTTQHRNQSFYVSKLDLSNFYHHIALPSFMQPYFALPPVRMSEVDSDSDSSVLVYPMCTTIPMGWSHAVYVAQNIHLHILYSSNVLASSNNILYTHDLHLNRTLHFIYIDDLSLVSPDYEHCVATHKSIMHAYERAGFVVKRSKVIDPTDQPVEVLGVQLCGLTHTLHVSSTKLLALQRSTADLISHGRCSGHALSRIVGSWVWPCLIRRPSLSIFRQVYRFIAVADTRTFTVWPSVVRELTLLSFLAPLLRVSLCANDFDYLLATDASLSGGALVKTHMSSTAFLSSTAPLMRSVPPHIQPSLSPLRRSEYTAALDGVGTYKWGTIASYKWNYQSHINVLEMNALLLGIRWASTYPRCMRSRVHCLVDSSTVYYSTHKGRSSSQLSSSLQRLAAHIFAFDIILHTYWIPSAYNPADAPSRLQ